MLKVVVIFILFISSAFSYGQALDVKDLKGTWISKKESRNYSIYFIDSRRLRVDSPKAVIMTYKVIPKGEYSFFIVNNSDYPDSTSFLFIARKINDTKLSLKYSIIRRYSSIDKKWNETSREDSKVSIWERKL